MSYFKIYFAKLKVIYKRKIFYFKIFFFTTTFFSTLNSVTGEGTINELKSW